MYALPAASTAMSAMVSGWLPPRYVAYTSVSPAALSFATNESR